MKPIAVVVISICYLLFSYNITGQTLSKELFNEPPIEYWPKPLWFWNNTTVTLEGVEKQMQEYRDHCGYGGFGILPFGKDFKPEYLKEEYFTVYGKALKKAKELNLTMWLYDEYGFPSGSMGLHNADGVGRFGLKYPEQTIKRLDKIEYDITGPAFFHKKIPEGRLMSVVGMETKTLQRIDLTNYISNELLEWNVPLGNWKIMFFTCVKDPDLIVDYLDPEAVKYFIKMTHDEYYSRFSDYFGTTLTGTFFDEPTMYRAQGRMWTNEYNEKFRQKYGFSPKSFYPALWYDIGTETQAARNYLFGFRAELYAKGFTKEINDWSIAHGVSATGHQDQEEVANPVSVSGDLMKTFKYLEIPGIDKIGGNRPAERYYKVISSAAYNWDKSLIMSETYGAMGNLDWNEIFSIAMDQYAKGINILIPHAVWYDVDNVTFKPELSHRNPLYADSLKIFNKFLSRLNYVLQSSGRHVADIAMLYPIHTIQGEHFFDGPLGPYRGGVNIPETDYIDVANWLTEDAGKDFTFIHPEVLDEKCPLINGKLHLRNKINWEEFRVLIIPSIKTISVTNLRKIDKFYKSGGTVIFTTRLPAKSVEPGNDEEVIQIINSIFPKGENNDGFVHFGNNGGRAIFIPQPNGQKLRNALKQTNIIFDVDYPVNEDIRYIHKVVDGQEVFYFANTGTQSVEIPVILRGKLKLQSWNPHTGEISGLNTKYMSNNERFVITTNGILYLKPFQSCFWIGKREK